MAKDALVACLRVVLSSGLADAVTDAGVGMAAKSLAVGDTPDTCPVRKRKRTASAALSACKLEIHHDAMDRSEGVAALTEAEICSSMETAVGPARTLAWREIALLDDRHALSGREKRPTGTGVQSACNVRATGEQSGLWSMAGSMKHQNHVSNNTAPPSLVVPRSRLNFPPAAGARGALQPVNGNNPFPPPPAMMLPQDADVSRQRNDMQL